MPTAAPTTSTTFALLLGAAEWPEYSGLDTPDALAGSAKAFEEYLGPKCLGLPTIHVRNLFGRNRLSAYWQPIESARVASTGRWSSGPPEARHSEAAAMLPACSHVYPQVQGGPR
jgi:hypothetical protein